MMTMKTKQWSGVKEVRVQGKFVVDRTSLELALVIEGQAKLLCPVDYGYLAASIHVSSKEFTSPLGTPTPDMTKPKSFPHDVTTFRKLDPPGNPDEIYVGTYVDYGPYVEYGTYKMNAQPFLRPAFDLALGKSLTLLRENYVKMVDGKAVNAQRYYFADYDRRPS